MENKIKDAFCRQTLNALLKLKDSTIVGFWNFFLEESIAYGGDSHIYNLNDKDEMGNFCEILTSVEYEVFLWKVQNYVAENHKMPLFVQAYRNGLDTMLTIQLIDDVRQFIMTFWDEIVERVMQYFEEYVAYDRSTLRVHTDESVMEKVFYPNMRLMLGFNI